MRIEKENCQALIIDVQEKLLPAMNDKDILLKNILTYIEGIKVLNVPLVFTQQYSKGLGETIELIKNSIPTFSFFEKVAFSCCDERLFFEHLVMSKKQFILIAGIEAHVCVLQTVIDLLTNGYQPVVIEDCITSRKPNDKLIALERMRNEGAIISTYESILFELCRHSGNEQFKSISKIIR